MTRYVSCCSVDKWRLLAELVLAFATLLIAIRTPVSEGLKKKPLDVPIHRY
jgi:hypothetical protein